MFAFDELQHYVDEGWVSTNRHPTAPLTIYNYTQKTQWERHWDEVTMACRGLILDDDGRVAARPFRKFFNLGEHAPDEIPDEPFEAFEKMDGSLGILYWDGTCPKIASRGSFTSEQATVGCDILRERYREQAYATNRQKTYLFEIIYPQNRIVVDYGGRRDLVLLAVIDDETGEDAPPSDTGFPGVRRYDGLTDLENVCAIQQDNQEGFVLRFRSGFRVKVKMEEYLRLHKLRTEFSSKSIWECLRAGKDVGELMDGVPDEFYAWVRSQESDLRSAFGRVESICRDQFRDDFQTRKEAAQYFKTCEYPAILFAMLDGKSYCDPIWRLVRPAYEQPFKTDG